MGEGAMAEGDGEAVDQLVVKMREALLVTDTRAWHEGDRGFEMRRVSAEEKRKWRALWRFVRGRPMPKEVEAQLFRLGR